jgi:hypothetical protein
MNKIAQRRGRWNKLREKIDLPGKLMESFSPEFQELMDHLREVDDKIREEASDLKDLLKVAKTNFNRREYMTAIAYLGRFHDKMENIDRELSQLSTIVDLKHNEFLFGDIDPEHLTYLVNKFGPKFQEAMQKMNPKFQQKFQVLKPKASQLERASLEKEAGITDWWHNITTNRGKTLAAWEKRFPKYARELKTQTNNILNKSEALLNYLMASLKAMASLRATRKLEEYLRTATRLKEKYKSYNAAFTNFYNSQVKRFIDYQVAQQAINQPNPTVVQSPAASPLPAGIPPVPPTTPSALAPDPYADVPTPPGHFRTHSPIIPFVSKTPLDFGPHKERVEKLKEIEKARKEQLAAPVPAEPDTVRVLPVEPAATPEVEVGETPTAKQNKKSDHEAFLSSIGTLENENPLVLAKEIISYAQTIAAENPEISNKLYKIAQNLLQR